MLNKRAKYLLKNTAIFTISNIATKIINFFLIPLYTHVLTTAEYGTIDLAVTICTIAVPIITLNIAESVMRFNLDKDADSDKIIKIGIVVFLIGCIVGGVSVQICDIFQKVSDLKLLIYFFVVSCAASQIFLCDLRGKELLIKYSIGNILCTFLIAIFNLFFLVQLKLGIKGYLLAYVIAYTITAIYALLMGKSYKALFMRLDRSKMIEMLKYSIVLIPNSFMWWIMNSSDHIMVTTMIGVTANGIYAISYKFPTLISTFTGIFNQAWQYSAIREEGAMDEEEYNNQVFKVVITVVMFIGVSMMAFIKPILSWYVSSDYYSAWRYTPFLIVGCVYLTLGTFISTSYTVHKDSLAFLISGSVGAVLNIILNYIFIPIMGVYGAAFATCMSYVSVFLFRLIHTKKYINYNVFTKEFLVGTIMIIGSGFLIFIDNSISQLVQMIIVVIYIIITHDILWIFLKNGKRKEKHGKIS